MADKFTIKIDGKERDVKMTFGLLNALCRAVGDIDGATQVTMDQNLRDAILVELLSERDKTGKIKNELNLAELDVEIDDMLEMLDWAGNHIMDFFLKGLERAKALQDRNMGRLKALMPSPAGSAS
jgi:hypothetical protein